MDFKTRLRNGWALFLYFFRIGWFTFGGGWSIVAQVQKDFVENKKELTEQELLDMVSVGRSLPGTMIGNVAYLFGYHRCGVVGGVLAVLGMVTPALLILVVLVFCYDAVRDNPYVAKALVGVRACVVPIIAVAALKLWNSAFPKPVCYALCAGAFLLSTVWDISCVWLVALGAVAGLLLGVWEEKHSC